MTSSNSTNVVDLAQARIDRSPHLSGPCKCLNPACGHVWNGVVPDGSAEPFLCPKCNLHRGVWDCIFGAGAGQEQFVCFGCGVTHFIIRRTDVVCVGCGCATPFEGLQRGGASL